MNETLIWLVETTLAVSLFILLVLMIRKPVARFANARWAYLLWLLPAVRLVLAAVPPELSAAPAAAAQTAGLPTLAMTLDVSSLLNGVPAYLAVGLLVVWATGAVLAGGRLWFAHTAAIRALLQGSQRPSREQDRQLAAFGNRMGVFPMVRCRLSPSVRSPMLTGLLRPTLLLPTNFFETWAEPELVIRHELVHYRRRDIWLNVCVAAVRCGFWFNPLMGWAEARFRDDQEVACDRSVLDGESNARRRRYAESMIQAAAGHRAPFALGFVSTEPVIKRRTRAIVHARSGYWRELRGAASLAVLMLATLILGFDGSAFSMAWMPPLTFPAPIPGGCGG
ncbi:MAG: M56 family metallopeptidase [Pseudomonadota bacterium]